MPEIKNNFLQGKMNRDLDDRILPNGQYREAFNITVAKSDDSNVGTVQSVKGNDYLYSSGILSLSADVDTIGYYAHSITGEIFWFVTDFTGTTSDETKNFTVAASNKLCRIYYYKIGTSTAPVLLVNSFRLNFSKIHPILHVNIIDDLLFWTDNYNQPRRINIKTALANLKTDGTGNDYYSNDNYLEDKISVAQFAPYDAPTVALAVDTNIKSEHIEDKFVKLAYRFQYENNEYSLISPFTQTCFHPGFGKNIQLGAFSNGEAGLLSSADEDNIVKQTTVNVMQNLANKVHLKITLPCNVDKSNHAACNANGILSGTSQNIDNVNGTIADTDTLVTERGDTYVVNGGNKSTTLTTTTAINPSIIDNTRLYFFNSIAAYGNPLKIKKIQILYSESNSPAIKVVETIDFPQDNEITYRAEKLTENSAKLSYVYEFIYESTKPVQTLAESEIIRVSDIIPIKAKTQEVSGNRIIYGNFLQNRGLNDVLKSSDFEIKSGDQSVYNDQYLLSSVKSNREYSVGIVFSDRYGRQSSVFLPDKSTTFVDPKTGTVTNGQSSWKHSVIKVDFNQLLDEADFYNADTNPLGWYSYKFVVKQTQLQYYNVYAPTIVDGTPSGETRSWVVLHGDNVNKVPRDVTDLNEEDGTQGSQAKLLPKIIDTAGTQTQQSGTEFKDVISIGTLQDQGFLQNTDSATHNEFYLANKNPLLGELEDGLGVNYAGVGTVRDNLVVFETDPFISVLDIYFETSTAGRLDYLADAVALSLGAVPQNIAVTANSFNESVASGGTIATLSATDTQSNTVTGTFSIISIVDANNTNRSGAFTITGTSLKTNESFEFTNSNTDNYTIRIKVIDNSDATKFTEKNISMSVANVAPTITVGSTINLNQVPANTQVRTITAVNGSAKTSAQTNGLTFSKVSETLSSSTTNNFSINSTTGVVTTNPNTLPVGSYTLVFRATDTGGLTNDGTLTISVGSSTATLFFKSPGSTSFAAACNDSANQTVYFDSGQSQTGGSSIPDSGDVVHTTIYLNSPFNGQGAHYRVSDSVGSDGGYIVTINSSGVVSVVGQVCPE